MEDTNLNESSTKPEEVVTYQLEGSDLDAVSEALSKINMLMLERGVFRTQYIDGERLISKKIDEALGIRDTLIKLAKQRLKVPDGYVLDPNSMEFVRQPKQNGPAQIS